MPRLLLLLPATTYRADAFLEAAQRLGVEVTIGSDRGHPLAGREPEFLSLDLRILERARQAAAVFAQRHPFDAVVGVDDNTAVLAAAISETLGLPHNSVQSVSAARNKYLMRRLLREHGVPVPDFVAFSIDEEPPIAGAGAKGFRFPCVVKPIALSASCGVMRANDDEELTAAFRRVAALLRRLGLPSEDSGGRYILVENFIPGREVALEGLLTHGELQVLALYDKPDPMEGPFFEETIYVTPSRLTAALQTDIASCAENAATALGLKEGPVHGELRVNEMGVWLIELAARSIGGRCSGTLRFAAGMSLEEVILRHALRLELPPLEREHAAAGVMMLPIPQAGILSEVQGEKEALAVDGIEEVSVTARPGEILVPLPEGTRYLGFILARGATPEVVEASLREAHRRLTFSILPAQAAGSRAMSF